MLCTVSGEWGGEGEREVREKGGREGRLFVLPSASAWAQRRKRGEGRDAGSSGKWEWKEEEEEVSLPSLCMQINRIPEHRCHMTAAGGGWGLHRADTAEWEGLCQLSDDVMIYFEEVMSGFCSEAGRAYSGTTLVQISRTTSVDLNRHVYPWNRMCVLQRHQF